MKNYICFGGGFSLHYMYVDKPTYVADSIFYKHKIPVKFKGEYIHDNEPYILVTCKIKKRYKEKFEKALSEIADKMLLLGNSDYEQWCDKIIAQIQGETA